MNLQKILGKKVTLHNSHLWIVALGAVIALGFAVNCIVYPFYEGCTPIDNEQLILSASILAGLGTAREFMLRKFKYLKDIEKQKYASVLKDIEKQKYNSDMIAENILKEKIWVPAIGWFLTAGFMVNMLILPFFPSFRTVDWSFLQSAITIFLALSGAREYGYYSHKGQEEAATVTNKENQRESMSTNE